MEKEKTKETRAINQKQGIRNIGVIGSRSLPYTYRQKVGEVVDDLLSRNFNIASGGAIGADQFCLDQLINTNNCAKSTLFSAWKNYKGFPAKVRQFARQAQQQGTSIIWGPATGQEPQALIRFALLKRNERLVQACYGLVAFIMPNSRGSLFTISKAIKAHLPIVVFPVGCELPHYKTVKWVPLRCGGCWEGGFKAVFLR
jgi:predicted Rossmann fold nucleotide-binding protein DprA/Smf involved in DNA uptake